MDFSTLFYPDFKENLENMDPISIKPKRKIWLFRVQIFTNLTNVEELYVEFYINRIKGLENTDNVTFRS
jgi:hypothetical protein